MSTFRRWYKDRDFPEIKASNADVLLPFERVHEERAMALMAEHNAAVDEIEKLKEMNTHRVGQGVKLHTAEKELENLKNLVRNECKPAIAVLRTACDVVGLKAGVDAADSLWEKLKNI